MTGSMHIPGRGKVTSALLMTQLLRQESFHILENTLLHFVDEYVDVSDSCLLSRCEPVSRSLFHLERVQIAFF